MADVVTREELEEAKVDVADLASIVNGGPADPDVVTRLGTVVKPVAKVIATAEAQLAQAVADQEVQEQNATAAAEAAVAARDLSIAARDASIAAKDQSVEAKDQSVAAKDEALAAIGSFQTETNAALEAHRTETNDAITTFQNEVNEALGIFRHKHDIEVGDGTAPIQEGGFYVERSTAFAFRGGRFVGQVIDPPAGAGTVDVTVLADNAIVYGPVTVGPGETLNEDLNFLIPAGANPSFHFGNVNGNVRSVYAKVDGDQT